MLTCGVWVKRGIAKEEPDRVTLTEEDLKNLVDNTKDKIQDVEGLDNEELEKALADLVDPNEELEEVEEENIDEDKTVEPQENDEDEAIRKEYGLDGYDEEGALMTGAGMAGLMYFSTNKEDPYVNLKNLDEDDKEDFLIKKDDNLVVIGKMEEDYSCLEIFVYNENEDSLYVHHDILLEAFPLCLEWLSYDPGLDGKSGNLIAVGTMEPDVQIWDLDVVDAIEPAFVLAGAKKKKKKAKATPNNGHSDAVLGLSWNHNVKNVLASSSADKTVKLWDMSQGTCVHSLTHHKDKVQAVKWHPYEAQSLLSGSFDKTAAVLDCRKPDMYKSWSLSGECEQVLWDHFSPYHFFVSCDDGVLCYFDVREEKPIFTLHAHDEAVTGISLASQMPGCLTTVSSDKILKVWDYQNDKPQCVLSRDMKMGNMNFICPCPDISMGFAVGGEKDGLRVFNVMETNQGKVHFESRESKLPPMKQESTPDDNTTKEIGTSQDVDVTNQSEAMDAQESTANAMATLTLKLDSTETKTEIIKRKKKKKKKK